MDGGGEGSAPSLADLRIPDGARAPAPGRRRWPWFAGAGLVIAGAVLAALLGGGGVEVTTAEARPAAGAGPLAILNASGYVTPRVKATVAAKVTGRVAEVLVEEGMSVRQGQVLARIDDSDARALLASAAAEGAAAEAALPEIRVDLEDAERTLARTASLRESGHIDQQSLDRARAARDALRARLEATEAGVRAARARMEVARRDVENCVVRAPFSGVAVSKDAQPGEMVSPVSAGGGFTRTGISTVVDMSSLEIEVDVNESYISKVTPGQRVEATLDAYPDWTVPCSVRTVIPTADRQKATVKVRIAFDALDPRILPDMGVKVAFLMGPSQGEVRGVWVPKECVGEEGGQRVAFVLAGGRLERRAVRVGELAGSEVNLTDGVAPGERVVLRGSGELGDGARAREKVSR